MSGQGDYSGMAPQYSNLGVFCIFIFPAAGGLLFGYDIGATSYVLTQLQDEHASGVTWWHSISKSSVLQGVLPSTVVAGALVGSLVVFKVADTIGRRREMQLAALLYIAGATVESIAADSGWDAALGISTLMLGRFAYGIGCGFAMHGAPSYIAEMSPPDIRGTLVSLKEAMIVVGILLGYVVGYLLQDQKGAWRWTYGVAVIPALIMLAGVTYLPPSARWLALKGRMEEARRSLDFVYTIGAHEVLSEVAEQAMQNEAETKGKASSIGDMKAPTLWDQRYRRALVAGVGVVVLQQITGQPSILYYANSIFDDAGMSSYAAVLTGVFKLVATLGSVVAVDRYGRRYLLFLGIAIMLVALGVMTFVFAGYDTTDDDSGEHDDLDWRTLTIIIGMFAYIGGYQLGFGPIAWLLISEIFPLEVRGQAVAFSVQMNFFWNLVVTFVYPQLIDGCAALFGDDFRYCAGFGLFAILTAYSLYFVQQNVPETKGLSLEEIERFLCSGDKDAELEAGRISNNPNEPLLGTRG